MKRYVGFATFIVLMLAAPMCEAQTRETQQRNLERYLKYAGDPVKEFPFWHLYQWELVGPDKVVVWSTLRDAYLLTVEQPCAQLEWTHAIGVTSNQRHVVSTTFDYVTADHDQCKISQIRPINYTAMRNQEKSDNDPKSKS